MKKWIIAVVIGLGAAGLGVGSAFALNSTISTRLATANDTAQNQPALQCAQNGQGFGPSFNQQNGRQANNQNQNCQQGRGQNQQFGPQYGGGMMGRFNGQQQGQGQYQQYGPQFGGGMMNQSYGPQQGQGQNSQTNGERISLDDAYTKAQAYVSALGSNLQIAEIMEFENDFYVVVTETDSGRGAMELIVDPISGSVSRERGADMMWNLKYGGMGMMAAQSATDSTLTLDEARAAAQQALDDSGENAVVNDGGYSFYGYYTFDYSIDGQTAGMLSINGLTGQALFHTWHGTFISEKEY